MTNLTITNKKAEYVSLTIVSVEKLQVTLKYHTLRNNNPNENGNYIGLWRTSDGTVPDRAAEWSVPIKKNETEALITERMPLKDAMYVVGFCPNGDPKISESAWKNVAATTIIEPKNNQSNEHDKTINLNVAGANTDVVRLEYQLIEGMQNKRHWIGLWDIDNGPSDFSTAPDYKTLVDEADSNRKGRISLADAGIFRDTNYIVGYFFDDFGKTPSYSKKHLVGTLIFET